jgi:hypothetical protein
MCRLAMVLSWSRETGEPLQLIEKCFYGSPKYSLRGYDKDYSSISIYNSVQHAILDGWSRDKSGEWCCPECNEKSY